MGLRKKYANRRLRKIEGKSLRNPTIPDLDSIKKVGIVWEPGDEAAFQYLKTYFYEKGTVVHSLCVGNKNAGFAPGTDSLTPKGLNWLNLPKPGQIDTFARQGFDLLLNITLTQSVALDFINLCTQAKFKAGWSPNEKNYLDLNIIIEKNKDAMFLAQQQIFYIGQLNQKTIT